MRNKILNSPLRLEIDKLIRQGESSTSISKWCKLNGLNISQQAVSYYRAKIESSVHSEIKNVATEIAKEKIDYVETLDTGILTLKKVLINSDIQRMKCRNPKELAIISTAMATISKISNEMKKEYGNIEGSRFLTFIQQKIQQANENTKENNE